MREVINELDYATLAVSSTAVTLVDDASPTLPARGNRALITVETDSVRWRADGTAPTSSEGHLVNPGDTINLVGANFRNVLEKIQFIRVTGDAALKISYFGD